MAQENYIEGCSMQRPPLLEPNGFCFWKARFETYFNSKDIDLWQVIQNGDFYFEVEDSETKDKVTAIEEAKYLATLPLDELIGNLEVYETILGSDDVSSKTIKEKVMPITLKANITKGQTSNNSTCQDESDEDKEFNLMAKNFRKLFQKGVNKHDKFDICKEKTKSGKSSRRECGCYNCSNKNHLIDNCPKPNRNKAFIRVAWSDNEDGDEPPNDATCLMAINSQEIMARDLIMKSNLEPFVTNMEFLTTSRHLVLLNLMGLLKGRTELCKK
ncbi:zf-CCHC domain-containing protein [Tanacetum coccineum]|uniref:Zf-CCHC domain-containing protein n=1 Tax=Tanacetum coccineum TaxID=301880 RepID=A0ABQ4XPN2_9ASTR